MKSFRMSGHCLAALALLFAASLCAQMVSPSIDQSGQPFSYFSKPTDEIGVMGAEAATEITPEGYLRTGFGEFMFFAGPELEPTSVRIRTLEQGHLPIVHYEFARDGILYSFTLFAATLDGSESGPLVNFIRVEMKNASHQPTRAIFSTGIRYDALSTTGLPHGDNRFLRPAEGKFPGAYRQIGEPFNRQWANSFDAAHFFRDGRLLYSFPLGYAERGFTLRGQIRDMHSPDLDKPAHLNVEPETPVGIVTYSTLLAPGAHCTLDFKMPVVSTADPQILSALDQAGFDAAKAQIIAYWNNILSAGMQIELPEPKAVDTFSASLIYDLIAIDHIGPDFIQTVNKLHYHSFYLRDGADIVHSYDVTGYPQIARECLDFFAKSQKPDGNFLSQPQQYDGWGEAVWAYAQHYRMTHDKEFADGPSRRSIAPSTGSIKRAPPTRCTSFPPAMCATTSTSPAISPATTFSRSTACALPSPWRAKPAAPISRKNGRPSMTVFTRRSSRFSTRRPPRTTATFRRCSTVKTAATTGAICSPLSPSPRSTRTMLASLQLSALRRPNTPRAS